ncbi:MAG: LptF/LptG family permease, partial [Paracoccaceae bacterium]
YILSQLMGPFAVFSLILIGVYWLARAIGIFDELIGDGQTVIAFFRIMILFLPQVVAIVLPIVSFAAALYVGNRLQSESEMLVILGAGVSPLGVLRPFLIYGLLIGLFAAALSHFLVPASQVQFAQLQRELANDAATRMIVSGKFIHPAEDVTFFVEKVENDGSLSNIFLFDQRNPNRDVTYSARQAVLFRSDEDARLVMFDGLVQTLDLDSMLLSKLQFDEFVFDVGTLTGKPDPTKRLIHEFSTAELLSPTPDMLANSGSSRAKFRMSAHLRIEQPLQSFVYPLIGAAIMIVGNFSRFGVLRQVIGAVAIVTVLNALSVPFRGIVRRDIELWWLIYIPDLLGLSAVFLIMRRMSRRGRRRFGRSRAIAGGTP